ncbi:MAG: sigma 54-interacting transcriptional regulator [Planctomycetes bacterium]|nr:sigma 54-interacting transcriptional regulator [Planctomycetota bacterium]
MPPVQTAYIVARQENGFGKVHPLQKGTRYSIGRAPTNKIILNDDLCSREHAEIHFTDGEWILRDLGSLNGSRLNGNPVRDEVSLAPNDNLQLGHSQFVFVEDLSELPGIPESSLGERLEIRKRMGTTRYGSIIPSSAVNNDSTIPETHRSERIIAVLYQLGLNMGAAETLEELVDVVLDGLLEGVHAEVGAVLAMKEGRDTELLAHRNRHAKAVTYHKVSGFVSAEVLSTKEAILAENIGSDPALRNRESLNELKVLSLICAPVIFESSILGLVHLYSTTMKHALSADDLEFALLVSRQFGIAWNQMKRRGALSGANKVLIDSLRLESELVGESPALKQIESQIRRVASTNATVLIRGESGSGKELVARAIHQSSPRRDGPFVCLNCAAITESLLESELFGHERGAFTGATEKMVGKFEAANHGTIFLDEIGEMPLSTQSKFLRVLEGHAFERLGGNNKIQVDVRVVAATNRALEEAVRAGQFRKDLFFRLQVVEIKVPSLRERITDVPLLADHFLKRFVNETGRKFKGFTDAALEKLMGYHWPGNVRELRNVIERAVALTLGPILDAPDIWLSTIDVESSGSHKPVFKPSSLEEMERKQILLTLVHTDWNKSKTAEILGIERSTLDRKIKAYDLKKDE